MSSVMTMRPWAGSSGERNWYSASSVVTPSGTVTWKAKTSTGSRVHSTGLPLAVNFRPASWVKGPLGPWFAGSHCGYRKVIGPGLTGTVMCMRKICCARLVASTFSTMVPG